MKRKLLILSVLAICVAMLAGGTLAFFTSEDKAHNVITTGGVEITLQEWADEAKTTPFKDLTGVMPNTTVTKIAEIKKLLKVLNENKKVYELELIEKQKIQATSIIKIQKYKGIYSTTTDIEIYLDKVDKNGNLIDDVVFRRLQYSDRTLLSSILASLYEEYGFKKIITSMKLPKAISEKYNVEFDETMKRGFRDRR